MRAQWVNQLVKVTCCAAICKSFERGYACKATLEKRQKEELLMYKKNRECRHTPGQQEKKTSARESSDVRVLYLSIEMRGWSMWNQ